MYSPRPVPGIRDSRTFQARWNGSRTRRRSASRDADALVVDGDDGAAVAVDPATDRTIGAPAGAVLQGVADEVLEHLADPAAVDVDRRQVGRQVDDEPAHRWPRHARSPRSRATSDGERDRRPLEDQRVGIEMGDVEDLVDERRRAGP